MFSWRRKVLWHFLYPIPVDSKKVDYYQKITQRFVNVKKRQEHSGCQKQQILTFFPPAAQNLRQRMVMIKTPTLNGQFSKWRKTVRRVFAYRVSSLHCPHGPALLVEVIDSLCRKAWELLNVCSCAVAHAASLDLYAYGSALIHIRPPRYASGITDHRYRSLMAYFHQRSSTKCLKTFHFKFVHFRSRTYYHITYKSFKHFWTPSQFLVVKCSQLTHRGIVMIPQGMGKKYLFVIWRCEPLHLLFHCCVLCPPPKWS